MADPQQANPNGESAASARREAKEASAKPQDRSREAEPRSFQTASDSAGSVARDTAHAMAEGGRKLAEAGQQTAQEMSQAWRASLEPFTSMQMEMNRRFEDLWRQVTGGGLTGMRSSRLFGSLSAGALFGLPASDIRESETAYQLIIELPGLEREDVDLSLRGDSLIVCGHKSEDKEDATAAYRLSERRFGRFQRSFPIPQDVDRAGIEASFRNGVLRITLPRTAQPGQQGQKIEIRS